MKYFQVLLIAGVCSLLSCSKQDNDLSGMWIGAYILNPDSSRSSLNWFVEVGDDQLKVYTLKLDGVDPPKTSVSFRYELKGNQIVIYPHNEVDSIEIFSKTNDSLVLKYREEGDSKFVFKKFTRSPSPKVPLFDGKSFRIFSRNFDDSISFITDVIYIKISSRYISGRRWATTAIHDYQFLLLGEQTPPHLLTSVKGDTLTFENFAYRYKYLHLIKLNDRHLSLEGRWEEVSREYDTDLPPPPALHKMELSFGPDSCEITYGDEVRKRRWGLNSTSEILYFDPVAMANDYHWAWRVEKKGADSLIVDPGILWGGFGNEPQEKIIFRKKR